MSDSEALAITLPARGAPADIGHWWHLLDGRMIGTGSGVQSLRARLGMREAASVHTVGIAPAAETTLHRATFTDLTPRQAEAAARIFAIEHSIAGTGALHVAVGDADAEGVRDVADIGVLKDTDMLGHWSPSCVVMMWVNASPRRSTG